MKIAQGFWQKQESLYRRFLVVEITIAVTDEEKESVVAAINKLNELPNIVYMTQRMIAVEAQIKVTKIRAILIALIEEGRIVQYAATDNPRLQRFYYSVAETTETQ